MCESRLRNVTNGGSCCSSERASRDLLIEADTRILRMNLSRDRRSERVALPVHGAPFRASALPFCRSSLLRPLLTRCNCDASFPRLRLPRFSRQQSIPNRAYQWTSQCFTRELLLAAFYLVNCSLRSRLILRPLCPLGILHQRSVEAGSRGTKGSWFAEIPRTVAPRSLLSRAADSRSFR